MDKKQDQLKDHSYDGIQEYDNKLPLWWVGTFVITVLFGLGYWMYYYIYAVGPNLSQEWKQDLDNHNKQFASKGDSPLNDDEILSLIQNKEKAQTFFGEAPDLFAKNCSACHGAQAQGVIGPNLTDDSWIHGGKPSQIAQTIESGVAAKGMPTWKGILSPSQIKKLTVYILSLQGSNPPGAKAPEGEKI